MGWFWSRAMLEDFELIDRSVLEACRGKSVVISGATGFIGSLLARLLIWANKEHRLDVKLMLVARDEQRLHGMFDEYGRDGDIEYHVRDFSQPSMLLGSPFDLIVHTAAVTSSKTMVDNPVGVLDISYYGAKWALECARLNRHAKVVLLSSMEASGRFDEPVVADESVLGSIDLNSVRSSYPEGKRVVELLCRCYAEEYGVDVTVARLAQTFGAGILLSEGRVFYQFAKSAVEGRDIVLHTDGLSDGNYVYSSDALNAILLLVRDGAAGETYNVSNEECHTTIKEMAEMVAETFGCGKINIVVEANDAPELGYAAPTKMLLSSSKLRRLGWVPRRDLRESYSRLIDYLKDCD